MEWLQSDRAVYAAGGIAMVLSFVFAVGIVHVIPGVDVTVGTLVTFSVGFAVSIGVYFAARWIYRAVDESETASVAATEDSMESEPR